MRVQSKKEELLNAITHGIGVFLGIVGLIFLILKVDKESPYGIISVLIYGVSIIVLFLASTLYHSVENIRLKSRFRIVDHISIYLLIAGTYTPVLLHLLTHSLGWELFWIVCGIAFLGIIMKIFFTGKFEIFSTLLYLLMGWLIVFDYSKLSELLGPDGVLFLFAGGLFYTVGIIFYVFEKITFNHVIWHVFVLFGAISHFLMVYFFVI